MEETYSFGIKGNALQWLNSYPFGRSQFVVCRDSASELRHLCLGSRKGRSWVQLNIFIINMSKACHNSDVALIVDDTEIHLSSKVVGEAEYRINYDLRTLITVLFVTRKRR